jgi:hypothetical protein
MVWFTSHREAVMLSVRAGGSDRFELVLRAHGRTWVMQSFDSLEQAIRRRAQIEDAVRRREALRLEVHA